MPYLRKYLTKKCDRGQRKFDKDEYTEDDGPLQQGGQAQYAPYPQQQGFGAGYPGAPLFDDSSSSSSCSCCDDEDDDSYELYSAKVNTVSAESEVKPVVQKKKKWYDGLCF